MDGFFRPDTPLLCFYPFPLAVSGVVFSVLIHLCCVSTLCLLAVSGMVFSVLIPLCCVSTLCPLAVSGMVFSLSDTPLSSFVRWVRHVVMGR